MPWCPNCRYEYRPEVKECPNCQVALSATEPPQPSKLLGIRLDDKTASALRYLLPFRAGVAKGLRIAREAKRITFRSRTLLIAILLMAGFYLAGDIQRTRGLYWFSWTRMGGILGLFREYTSLTEYWEAIVLKYPMHSVMRDFSAPLAKPTSFYSPWIFALSHIFTHGKSFYELRQIGDALYKVLCIPLIAINSIILVVLLSWLRAVIMRTKLRYWKDSIRAHFWPVFLFSLIINLAFDLGAYRWRDYIELIRVHGWRWYWISSFVNPLFALAPFVMVNYDFGLWKGVKATARITWENPWTFLTLFITYGMVFNILRGLTIFLNALGRALLPHDLNDSYDQWVALAGCIALYFALALLGLWLAMCFTLLVMPKQEASEPTATPQNP